jgi:2-dehydropantoate 2-reductase
MARVAVIGAGNLGCYLGAHLAHAGHEVFFCVRRLPGPVRVDTLPTVEIPAYLSDPPPADWALVTVKAQDSSTAVTWLHALDRGGLQVAVVQNGVQQAERVRPFPALPVLSYVYVESRAGIHTGFTPPREEFTVPDTALGQDFQGLFRPSGLRVRCEPAFLDAAWKKMLHNCVSNPLTALAGRGLEILREPLYRDWAERILAEALPLARLEGARLSEEVVEETLAMLLSYPAGTRTSMLQDREQGRPLELSALNGALVELGLRHGRPTPANSEIVRLLRQ